MGAAKEKQTIHYIDKVTVCVVGAKLQLALRMDMDPPLRFTCRCYADTLSKLLLDTYIIVEWCVIGCVVDVRTYTVKTHVDERVDCVDPKCYQNLLQLRDLCTYSKNVYQYVMISELSTI